MLQPEELTFFRTTILDGRFVPTKNYSNQDPFQILVATILSAQSTWNSVEVLLDDMFVLYPTVASLAKADVSTIDAFLESLNLHQKKAEYLQKTALALQTRFQSQIPKTREELMSLPGVGRKTANVVLAEAFGIDTLAVDTHILRVANRLGISVTKNPDVVEQDLTPIFRGQLREAHHSLIWFGRKVCRALYPSCQKCDFGQFCRFRRQTAK